MLDKFTSIYKRERKYKMKNLDRVIVLVLVDFTNINAIVLTLGLSCNLFLHLRIFKMRMCAINQ